MRKITIKCMAVDHDLIPFGDVLTFVFFGRFSDWLRENNDRFRVITASMEAV